MHNPSLQDYLERMRLEFPGQLLEISYVVPRDFIINAIAFEFEHLKQNPILYFSSVEGSEMPVVANIFANRERIAYLLGVDESRIADRWSEIEKALIKPRLVNTGPIKEIVQTSENLDVTKLPIMKHFETDAGRYITSGVVVAKDPDTGVRNLSFHRMQLKNANRLGISFHSRQHLFDYFNRAEERNQALEVAVIIGAHPAVLLAASAKLGIDVDEYEIAGSILGEALELVNGETVDVEYPATAEIVLEGKVLPGVREPEGPFAEYTGYSTSRSTQNVLEITAICHRKKPIYLSIIPGPSSDHLFLMRVAKEASVLKKLREKIPAVRDIHYPKSGVNFHCYLSIGRVPDGVARHALMLLFGLDPYPKLAVIVDDDIDIKDEQAVWWAMATRMQGDRDIFIVSNVFTSPLDPSSIQGMSAKVGIDATMTSEIRNEVVVCRERPEHLSMARQIIKEYVDAGTRKK